MLRSRRILSAVALVALVGVTACSDEDRDNIADTADSVLDDAQDVVSSVADDVQDAASDVATDAAEVAVRNVASQAGAAEFDDAGAPLEGDLACETDASGGADAIAVNCTGTTADGKAAALTGTLNETPGASVTEIKGDFVGTVDDAEVFQTDSLGG